MHTETVGEQHNMSDVIGNLGDIPDLSDILGDTDTPTSTPFEDGWYVGTILGERRFTDSNGNERVFESGDAVSARGDSRNVKLQVKIKREVDGRELNTSALINYNPTDFSQETLQAVAKRREESKDNGGQMGDLFRPFMTITRVAKLQKIAGVRAFRRNSEGGLDLTPLYNKTGYFRLSPDDRNPQYKQIADFRADAPKKAKVL